MSIKNSMAAKRMSSFLTAKEWMRCPLCGSMMDIIDNSIVCKKGHCFDISKKGYINFLPNQKTMKGYDGFFFESRRKIMEDGFYKHIQRGILAYLSSIHSLKRIVDAGCGEGYYAKEIASQLSAQVAAFDISKEAVQLAANGGNRVCWFVSDITNIPVISHSADCLLNIFTPANYSEFKRILTANGFLIKIIPGENHLRELRHEVRGQIKIEKYSNQKIINYFQEHFILRDRKLFSKTTGISSIQLDDILAMTPLLFGVDQQCIKRNAISGITIEAEMLIGIPK